MRGWSFPWASVRGSGRKGSSGMLVTCCVSLEKFIRPCTYKLHILVYSLCYNEKFKLRNKNGSSVRVLPVDDPAQSGGVCSGAEPRETPNGKETRSLGLSTQTVEVNSAPSTRTRRPREQANEQQRPALHGRWTFLLRSSRHTASPHATGGPCQLFAHIRDCRAHC